MVEVVSRKVLAERRTLWDRLRVAVLDAERHETGDPKVASAVDALRVQRDALAGDVVIRVKCMVSECKRTEDVTVRVDDPQCSMPRTMLCGIHANPKDEQ